MSAIVFDLDGTLVDSLPDIAAAVNKMLCECDLPPLPDATIRGFVGNGLPKLVERVKGATGLVEETALERTLVHYKAAPSALTRPFPGAVEALTSLRSAGHTLGICTNKDHDLTVALLGDLGLLEIFEIVVGGDTCKTRKPDPEPLLHAFAQMPQSELLFIGDSEVDTETAERAGVPCGLYSQGYRKTPLEALPHAFSFDHFSQLPGIVSARLS